MGVARPDFCSFVRGALNLTGLGCAWSLLVGLISRCQSLKDTAISSIGQCVIFDGSKVLGKAKGM